MKILVTGGLGFVGSRFVELAKQNNHTIAVIDKHDLTDKDAECTFSKINICDGNQLNAACKDHDAIVHLAAEHRDDVRPISLYDDVNVEGTRNVCLAAEKNGINKILFTSSVAVYGLNNKSDEHKAPQPFNDYGRTKLAAEKILCEWQNKADNRTLVIIRPTVIFGENNRGNVYNLLRQLIVGPFLMIGSGENKKSMAYVGNVADFLFSCLSKNPGYHLYNYVDKPDLTMRELIAIINKLTRKSTKKSISIPYSLAMCGAWGLDMIACISGKKFPISRVRIKKFTADTMFATPALDKENYQRPYDMLSSLEKTIYHEFPQYVKDNRE